MMRLSGLKITVRYKFDKNHKENLNRNPLGLNREAIDDNKDE